MGWNTTFYVEEWGRGRGRVEEHLEEVLPTPTGLPCVSWVSGSAQCSLKLDHLVSLAEGFSAVASLSRRQGPSPLRL